MTKKIINYPSSIDLSEFKKEKSKEVKYGLPLDVKFCKSCVMTNQMPQSEIEHKHNISSVKKSLHFHDDGICAACHTTFTQKKIEIDWEERERQLRDLCKKYKSNNGSVSISPTYRIQNGGYSSGVFDEDYSRSKFEITTEIKFN